MGGRGRCLAEILGSGPAAGIYLIPAAPGSSRSASRDPRENVSGQTDQDPSSFIDAQDSGGRGCDVTGPGSGPLTVIGNFRPGTWE